MIRLREILILAMLGLTFSGTAHAQCGVLIPAVPQVCSTGCVVIVNECQSGHNDCYWTFPGVQCSCDTNEYFANAQHNPNACGQLVRPTVRASIKTAAGVARTFLIYLPNCKGSFSVEQVVS